MMQDEGNKRINSDKKHKRSCTILNVKFIYIFGIEAAQKYDFVKMKITSTKGVESDTFQFSQHSK